MAAAVLTTCLAYAGISVWQGISAGRAAAQAIGDETAVVTRGTLRVTVGGSGSLSPENEVALSFRSGGRVAEVLVEVGQTVQAGDVLARLDDADARQSVAQAESAVEQAQANLDAARTVTFVAPVANVQSGVVLYPVTGAACAVRPPGARRDDGRRRDRDGKPRERVAPAAARGSERGRRDVCAAPGRWGPGARRLRACARDVRADERGRG